MSPGGGRGQQLCQTLQLRQHERQPDGQLYSGPYRHNGPQERSLHEERWEADDITENTHINWVTVIVSVIIENPVKLYGRKNDIIVKVEPWPEGTTESPFQNFVHSMF